MAKRDIHAEPFDEGTLIKLKLFEYYARSWLPVFVARQNPIFSNVNIADFLKSMPPGLD